MTPPRFYGSDPTGAVAARWLNYRWPVALWQAVLAQAITDIVEGPDAAEVRAMKLPSSRHEDDYRCAILDAATLWMWSDDDALYTFVWVCEQLNLDPDYIRRLTTARVFARADA